MTEQQWQALLRLVLAGVGTFLINKGVFTSADWSTVSPYIYTAVGGIVSLGTALWTWWSHKPATIIATADKLKEQGK